MDLSELLAKSGFSAKEIAVYSAMLELGSAVVSDIAQKARLNRSTTYVILGSLTKRGLVDSTDRRGIKLFAPLPPKKLVEQLEASAKQQVANAKAARELLAHINIAEPAKTAEPRLHFFNSPEEMNEIFGEVVETLAMIRKGIKIYKDRVVFVSPDGKSGMVIESAEIAHTLKKAFNQ